MTGIGEGVPSAENQVSKVLDIPNHMFPTPQFFNELHFYWVLLSYLFQIQLGTISFFLLTAVSWLIDASSGPNFSGIEEK